MVPEPYIPLLCAPKSPRAHTSEPVQEAREAYTWTMQTFLYYYLLKNPPKIKNIIRPYKGDKGNVIFQFLGGFFTGSSSYEGHGAEAQ